jgi:hypothetical protein
MDMNKLHYYNNIILIIINTYFLLLTFQKNKSHFFDKLKINIIILRVILIIPSITLIYFIIKK